MKIKIFLLSVLISISNSALASGDGSGDGFHFDLNPTPITDVTIPPTIIKPDYDNGKNVELIGHYTIGLGPEFGGHEQAGYLLYKGIRSFKIKTDKLFHSYNYIYSSEALPKEDLIAKYYHTTPITLGYNNKREFSIPIAEYIARTNPPKIWNTSTLFDIFLHRGEQLIKKLKSWYLIIKFTDDTYDVLTESHSWSFDEK